MGTGAQPGRVIPAAAPHTETRLKSHTSQHTRVTEIVHKAPGTRGERGERPDLFLQKGALMAHWNGKGGDRTHTLQSASCKLAPGTVAAAADPQGRARDRKKSRDALVSLCENRGQGPRCYCASETGERSPVKVRCRHECGRRLAPGPMTPAVSHVCRPPRLHPACAPHTGL